MMQKTSLIKWPHIVGDWLEDVKHDDIWNDPTLLRQYVSDMKDDLELAKGFSFEQELTDDIKSVEERINELS